METPRPEMFRKTDDNEVEKATAHIIARLIEYEDSTIISKSIMKKSTGMVSAMSFARGEGSSEKTSPFDAFAQIIDGSANIMIDGKSNVLKTGQGIIIPAHTPNYVKPNGKFKMLLTTIKSGYEE